MNILKKMSESQLQLIEEAGEKVIDKDYNADEIRQLQNVITSHIFSKSKKEIQNEANKYYDILKIIGD